MLPPLAPPRFWFESLMLLLQGAGQSWRYRLLTAVECEEAATQRTRLELPAAAVTAAAAAAAAGVIAGRTSGNPGLSGGSLTRRTVSGPGAAAAAAATATSSLGLLPPAGGSGGSSGGCGAIGGFLTLGTGMPETPRPMGPLALGGQPATAGVRGALGGRTWNTTTAATAEESVVHHSKQPHLFGSTGSITAPRRIDFDSVGGNGLRLSTYSELPVSPLQHRQPLPQQPQHLSGAGGGFCTALQTDWNLTSPSIAVAAGGGSSVAAPEVMTFTSSAATAAAAAVSGAARAPVSPTGPVDTASEGDVDSGCNHEDVVAMLGMGLSREMGLEERMAMLPETLGIGDLLPAATTATTPLTQQQQQQRCTTAAAPMGSSGSRRGGGRGSSLSGS